MKLNQFLIKDRKKIKHINSSENLQNERNLILGFGGKEVLENDNIYSLLREDYPSSEIVLCSTAGEIFDDQVLDQTVSVTVINFEKTNFSIVQQNIAESEDSYLTGSILFQKLDQRDLNYVLIISDGGLVNGSELVRGIASVNANNVPVTGGLAGDGADFNYTLVGHNAHPAKGNIIAIGFYGDALQISHSSMGGWDVFGPEQTVTKSNANELFEIEDKNALELYKNYLGKYAEELPGSALLFPLSVKLEGSELPIVRTILSINEEKKSMIFAGDIPVGAQVRFMKANFDKLIDAANTAANKSIDNFDFHPKNPELALLISCVGRKLILGQRTDEEVEAVRDVFGSDTAITGFYSYGEISPFSPNAKCELHNQTMTITTFSEILP